MSWGTIFFLLILGALLLLFSFYSANKQTKTAKTVIESNDKLTESNNRLAEAVNHLAAVIEKKQ